MFTFLACKYSDKNQKLAIQRKIDKNNATLLVAETDSDVQYVALDKETRKVLQYANAVSQEYEPMVNSVIRQVSFDLPCIYLGRNKIMLLSY